MRHFDRDKLATDISKAMANLKGARNASYKPTQGIYFMVNPSQKEPTLRKAAKIGNRLIERNNAHEHPKLVRRKRVGFMFIGFVKPTKSVTIDVVASPQGLPKQTRNSLPITAGQNYKVIIRDPLTGKPLGKVKGRFLNGSNR